MDDAFITAYCKIDKDSSGTITADELRAYMVENNYAEEFVTKWLRLFDRQSTGVITLEEFCDVLGLEVSEFIDKRTALQQSSEAKEGVEIIKSNMITENEGALISVVREARNKFPDSYKEQCKYIKQNLDEILEKTWHCVVSNGQYWAFYSCEPECSITLKIEKMLYVLWRTP